MTASAGFAAQLGFDTTNPVTHRLEFARCTLAARQSAIDGNGIIGSRSRDIERVRSGLIHVGGEIEAEPSAAEWALLLPWLLGGTTSGSGDVTYNLGEIMPVRYVTVDKVAKVYTYDNVAVDKFTLSGAQGQPLKLRIELVGATETEANAGTFPAITIDLSTNVFVFHDGAITVGGTSTLVKSWELTVDNHIDRERFFNSVTLATPPLALDRTTTFKTQVAYDSSLGAAIYTAGGVTGVHVILNHTNGGSKLNIDMPKLSFPKQGVEIPGRVEEMLDVTGTAYRNGGASELTILSNVGP